MQHQQYIQESLSHPAFLMLACLVDEPKTATALHEAAVQATGQVIEPGAFSRVVARLEQRGWIAGDDGWERMRRYHITAFGLLALQQVEAKYQRNQEDQERNQWSPGLLRGKERMMRLVLWNLNL